MAPVERIEEAIANGVRAGGIVATMWQAVHELLANSIDAGAVSVEIKLDIPCYRFSVSDNGHGIPADKLRDLVGTQRATSKAECSQEMQPGCSYGFRGEALLSLGLTSLLEIQSRCEGRDARGKVVREGQTLHFGPATAPARTGTIVTVRDAFFKWPVRRKAINEVLCCAAFHEYALLIQATEMLRIKEQVARMALVNNSVSITVVDSAKSKTVLRAVASGSVIRAFSQVFASDKLSMAQKIAFEFKQFRITGYLSPPSSTACHWSKEFQILYVNRRCVRRLDFLHKTINAAFAPCLALLAGRGGSDGQGIVRRVRDPNASSGQRQELFPVFVLNIECRRGEVDVMADPDKTLVEFCDWPSARNAPVALLLAFLPRFPHAVPSTVLRDLRRAFHKNEGEEKWTVASPPAPITRAERNSPEPFSPPPPTPSPMRLAMPDVGVPSPLYGCDNWMGRDRNSGGIDFDRDVGLMASGGYEIPTEDDARHCAFPYPCSSPASRFGARNSCSALSATDSMHLSGNNLAEVDASPYFCRKREDGGGGDVDGPDHDGWDPLSGRDASLTSSPYFGSFDSRSRASRRWTTPQRRCSLGRRLAEASIEFKGSRLDCLGGSRGSEGVLSDALSSCGGKDMAGEIDAEVEKSESLASEAQNIRDRVSQDDRAKKAPETRFEGVLLSPPLAPVQPSFDASLVRPLINRRERDERCPGRASPIPSGAVRDNLRGSWLRCLPGASEEMVRPAEGKDDVGTDASAEEGKSGRGLSRLFDFAFTDKDRRQYSEQLTLQRGGCRDGIGYTPSAAVPAAAGASGAERAPRRSTSPRRLVSGHGSVTATELQALVGVTVRRPPSPQFSFMNKGVVLESSQPSCLERPSPMSSSPLQEQVRERENDTPSEHCDPEASGVSQGVIQGKSCDETEPPPGDNYSPVRTMGQGVAWRRRGKRPASSTETGSALTPPRRIKRRRPDWPLVESTGERERVSGGVGQHRWEPPTLLELKRLTVESPQRRHRADADRRLTPIREGSFASRGKRKVCSTEGWWGLDSSSTPCDNETAVRPSHDNAVGYQGDAATKDIDGERRFETLHENRDWERNEALLEFRTEEATRSSERCCDTGLKGSGMLGESDESGQQQTKELRGDLGTESMGHDGQGIKPVCRTSWQDTKSDHPAPSTGKLPWETVPVLEPDAALAYDRDNLGGDGVADGAIEWLGSREGLVPPEACDSCQVSDPGGATVSSPRGPGGIRARQLGGRTRLSKGSSLAGVKEKPIPEILQPGQDEIGAGVEAMPVTVTSGDLKKARVIGQAGRKFILLRAGTGALLCVDQHAADERIKLEELERQVLGAGKSSRNIEKLVLTPPESIKITSSDKDLLEQNRKVLSAWHFDIAVEQAEGNDINATVPQATLLAVPVVCGVRLSVQDLLGFLRYLRESVEPGSCPRWLRPPQVQHILNYKACHSAIRFGDVLTQSSCVDLIHKLALCARPFSCAHGRPSVVPLCVLGSGNASLK